MTLQEALEEFNQPLFDADQANQAMSETFTRRLIIKIEDLI